MFSNRFWIFACLIFVCVSFSFCDVREAVATIRSSNETLGTVTFRQEGPGQPVTVTGVLNNLRPPNALHGFHIHELGNISAADCTSAKTHWNPYRATHGDINAPTRHIGDLSNLKVDSAGSVQINFQIPAEKMPLVGPDSIVGRALVVHQGEDDLGLGGQTDSSTTGHAGGRLGCGVIGLASEFSPAKPDPGMQPRRSTASGGSVRKAIAVLRSSTGSQEYGVISFVQESGNPSVHVSGMLRGISLASVKHGFHVHQFGNVNCTAAGKRVLTFFIDFIFISPLPPSLFNFDPRKSGKRLCVCKKMKFWLFEIQLKTLKALKDCDSEKAPIRVLIL